MHLVTRDLPATASQGLTLEVQAWMILSLWNRGFYVAVLPPLSRCAVGPSCYAIRDSGKGTSSALHIEPVLVESHLVSLAIEPASSGQVWSYRIPFSQYIPERFAGSC